MKLFLLLEYKVYDNSKINNGGILVVLLACNLKTKIDDKQNLSLDRMIFMTKYDRVQVNCDFT